MDFTDAFRISRESTRRCASYSPASAFLATLHHVPGQANARARKPVLSSSVASTSGKAMWNEEQEGTTTTTTLVQIRTSISLQVVRTFSIPFKALDLHWSPDGKHVLVSGKEQFIVLLVFRRGPAQQQNDCFRSSGDVILNFKAGAEGLGSGPSSPQWAGNEAICYFCEEGLFATLLDVQSGHATVVANTRHARCYVSPSDGLIALLTRQDSSDVLFIFSTARLAYDSEPLIAFATHTNDAAGVFWSPDERLIAIKEGLLEYKVHIFSTFGHLQATFATDENVPRTILPSGDLGDAAAIITSNGGLGVRDVRCCSNGKYVAVSGFDDHVRVLETQAWTQRASFDLGSLGGSTGGHNSTTRPTPRAFREPCDWRAKTGGRSIVPFDLVTLPFALARLQYDFAKSLAKVGVTWMEWNAEGDMLAMRCGGVPNAVFVVDACSFTVPVLCSIVICQAPIAHTCWRTYDRRSELVIVCGTQAVFVWRRSGTSSEEQIAEAIPIPVDAFSATQILSSPNGKTIALLSDADTYCCAMEAVEATIVSQL